MINIQTGLLPVQTGVGYSSVEEYMINIQTGLLPVQTGVGYSSVEE